MDTFYYNLGIVIFIIYFDYTYVNLLRYWYRYALFVYIFWHFILRNRFLFLANTLDIQEQSDLLRKSIFFWVEKTKENKSFQEFYNFLYYCNISELHYKFDDTSLDLIKSHIKDLEQWGYISFNVRGVTRYEKISDIEKAKQNMLKLI